MDVAWIYYHLVSQWKPLKNWGGGDPIQSLHILKNKIFNPCLYFADSVEALQDVWMIGDQFLRVTMKELSAMAKKARTRKSGKPHIIQWYNVNGYFAGMGIRGPLKILNPVIYALNDINHLPKYLIIIPDKDLMTEFTKQCTAFKIAEKLHYNLGCPFHV